MRTLLGPALRFTAIATLLYALLFAGSEALMRANGRSHPLFKIDCLRDPVVDWVVLGASHAMPMDFDDVNAGLERASGMRIVQLAGPGTGPLFNRFVFEKFLERHSARRLLYVVDAFAFYSPTWNEERFADAKLTRRMPWDPATAGLLARFVWREGVDVRAWLDYTSGFSKVNNRERFERDQWEGEAQFDRVGSGSTSAIAKRIAYLYPDKTPESSRRRYLDTFARLLERARAQGMQVTVVKLPVPAAFRRRLPDEAAFDAGLAPILKANDARYLDFSGAVPDPKAYFDTDHLNRKGLADFSAATLVPLFAGTLR